MGLHIYLYAYTTHCTNIMHSWFPTTYNFVLLYSFLSKTFLLIFIDKDISTCMLPFSEFATFSGQNKLTFSADLTLVYLISSLPFLPFITSKISINFTCRICLYTIFWSLFSLMVLFWRYLRAKSCVSSLKSAGTLCKKTLEILNKRKTVSEFKNSNIKGKHIYFSFNSKQIDHTFFTYLK